MSEPKWGSGERSLLSNPAVFNDLLLNWCSTTTSTNMSHQAWAIADLPHRHWKLKYLPDEFRSEDIKDENHPYYSLLQTFDQLRDLQFTTDDIPALACLEPKLQQIGKIIDKLIDLPGPYAKGIFDFTALSAYVHTINDLWSKKNQMYLTPIWRQPWEYRYPYQHYSESLVYDPILLSQLSQISLILDWWLGKPQFDFWIGIIDLNFDNFSTQLEAYVHWYNAVFFPVIKETPRDNKKINEKTGSDDKKCEEISSSKKEESDSESESEEEIDIESIDKECEQDSKGHTNNNTTNNNSKRMYRLKSDDDSSECDWSSSSDF